MAKDKRGVRGPGGPPPVPPRGAKPAAPRSADRQSLERWSYPILVRLRRVPRWIMVVVPAVLLFGGLVVPIAWLGAILLVIVAVFLGWLLTLSWPVLTQSSRLLRLIVIVAVFGIALLKATGRL